MNEITGTYGKEAIMPIGAMARALGVHQRSLRIYDEEGILSPDRIGNNRRYYSLNDLEKAKLILFLTRNLSVNLACVKIIIKILEENNIKGTRTQLEYLTKIADMAKIDKDVRRINVEKNAKRGRKINKQP